MTQLPQMPHRVTIRNPSPASVDPDTGNTRSVGVTEVATRAYLSQQGVAILSSYVEITGRQDTTISLFTLIVPASATLTDKSQIVDEQGRIYRINGAVAERRGLNGGRAVLFKAASMHLVSDLQN